MDRRALLGGAAALAAGGLTLTTATTATATTATASGATDASGDAAAADGDLYVERIDDARLMVWTRRPGQAWIRYDLRRFTIPDKRMDAWRIQEIAAVRQAAPPPATVTPIPLTTAGAYAFAIKPAGAPDHFGGIHGDELLKHSLFLVDGRNANPAGVIAAEEFELAQDTEVLDPALTTSTVLGEANVRHVFTADGLRLRWVLRWRASRAIEYAYGAMLPAIRDPAVTTRLRYLDQAREYDISQAGHHAPPADSYGVQLYNTANSAVLSVEVEPGFFAGYAQSDGRGMWVYDGASYNKVYPTRVSKPGSEQVAAGDEWRLDAIYRFRHPA